MKFDNAQTPNYFSWTGRQGVRAFDHDIIRSRFEELKSIRVKGDANELLYYFSEGIHGNMAGMGAPEIYASNHNHEAYDLIKSYVDEVSLGLSQIANLPASVLSDAAKLSFFQRSSQAYGRCALMLSGAGSMAPFHLGVCKALASQGLLPKVISGSSGGAIIASIICTHSDDELSSLLQSEKLSEMFNLVHAAYEEDTNLLTGNDVAKIIDAWIPDVTFAEAFEKTGRHLCISVAPAELHQQSRTLNSVTTPNVLLRESIQASCAVPGFMEPVKLMARGIDGARVPYVSSRSWIDGSVTDDLPASRLRRIFGCNFFIASQTNPMILWSVRDPDSKGPMSDWAYFWQSCWANVGKSLVWHMLGKMVGNVGDFCCMHFGSICCSQSPALPPSGPEYARECRAAVRALVHPICIARRVRDARRPLPAMAGIARARPCPNGGRGAIAIEVCLHVIVRQPPSRQHG